MLFLIITRLVFLLPLAACLVGVFFAFNRRYRWIYAVGLVLLVAYAMFFNRSIPGHVFRWVKGEQGMNQMADDFFADTQASVHPADLQHWAMTMMQQTPPSDSPVDIPVQQVPAYFREVPGFPLKDHWIRHGAVYLGFGGGLGHFGLCIGAPSFTVAVNPAVSNPYAPVYTPWKPGIYFWISG